jgi:hypothetical protein
MEMVCRNGRMAGVNYGERLVSPACPQEGCGQGRHKGQRCVGKAHSLSKHSLSSYDVLGLMSTKERDILIK